jgi:hypothetical protein
VKIEIPTLQPDADAVFDESPTMNFVGYRACVKYEWAVIWHGERLYPDEEQAKQEAEDHLIVKFKALLNG